MVQRNYPSISRRQFLGASAATFASACNRSATPKLAKALPQHPNFVVFLSDTLRADHLPTYGYAKPTAPEIARFSEKAYVFENCHAAATWTLPSTTTVLTGTHPIVHRMTVSEWKDDGFRHQVLAESIPTTAQYLKSRGYQTAFFQTNPNASRERGIARGFDHHYYELNAKPGRQVDSVLDWLSNEAKEPFYAYIHLIDPHEPYEADEEAFRRLHGRSILADIDKLPAGESGRLRDYHQIPWDHFYIDKIRLTDEELSGFSKAGIGHVIDLYDSEIVRVDEAFGRLMGWLAESGVGQRTITVVTSDHGEAFGEDGQFYHGNFLHDAQTHVPLLVHLPNSRSDHRIPLTAGLSDIHPTLLELAGIPVLAPATGVSLLNRDGMLNHREGRPVLTVLDHYQPDSSGWDFSLTAGPVRVRGKSGRQEVEVFSTDGSLETSIVRLDSTAKILQASLATDDDTLRLVGQYLLHQEKFLALAAKYPEPTWHQTENFDVEGFRALGYL